VEKSVKNNIEPKSGSLGYCCINASWPTSSQPTCCRLLFVYRHPVPSTALDSGVFASNATAETISAEDIAAKL